jgi:K+-transporting ATPase ATPase C chain
MLKHLRPAFACLVLLTVVTGVAYPLLVTAVARTVFPRQAGGTLLSDGGGSALIGQPFDDPKYFWGRLSATLDAEGKPLAYNGANSSGSNLGPTNASLTDAAKARLDALRALDPSDKEAPVDLVTSSGSGLDPDISPAAAEYQVHRVAQSRHLDETALRQMIARHTQGRQLGLLGEERVNVLALNRELDGK